MFTAIHNGHEVRDELKDNFKIDDDTQLREEDPFTEYFTKVVANQIIVNTSRFEVDLNRNLEKCFYINPADAWGLEVHKTKPTDEMIDASRKEYEVFYKRTKLFLDEMLQIHDIFFVLDIHSYNHQRKGIDAQFDDPQKNPEIILGTNNMDKRYFPFVDKIKEEIGKFDYFGRKLDVRINVKYPGGNFSRWLHNTYPDKVICIAIEFKKIFMNEWTAEIYEDKMDKLQEMLQFIKPTILKELFYLQRKR
ncbi:MAG: N-formylglutamate amidohydrolase [Candidatus Cloacimonadota bacterium]|nr:N-formylglutamate amidohydrolase [Candidatus Cloacimonadota bacterium]